MKRHVNLLDQGRISMRTLHLTNTQFDVLYGILKDTVSDIEEDVLYDTVTYEIYEKLIQMGGKS